ncbi:DUF4184 family protein [Nannocystis punicea]|uniref:DUF4184 family protein n=1 Tax=Nannocystis punicea TaxID=2995304 RepID=A0ABY7GXV2_9BACT|nr:DUF4184 family protein [Nannocystis poenicansa]WAS91773.1 DUF4184 family protein [Nannocystis poenicansa]
MPLTFPSHAAAVLPLLHLPGARRLPASALVLGSTAPDLVYLVGTLGAAAHHPRGLISSCLPAGLLAFLYVEALLLPIVGPWLVATSPARARPIVARLLGPRPLPRTLGAWLLVLLALLVGAATHQLWDGFTHAWMWPARALYPATTVSLLGHPVLLSRVLQHLSSVLGLVVVLAYLRRTTAPAPATSEPGERSDAARRLLVLLAAPLLAACVAACMQLRDPHPRLTRALWDAAWSATAWFALLLGLECLGLRLRRGSR